MGLPGVFTGEPETPAIHKRETPKVRTSLRNTIGCLVSAALLSTPGAGAAVAAGTAEPLQDTDLAYRTVIWSTGDAPDEESLSTRVPKGWPGEATGHGERTFTSRNGLWRLRVDGSLNRDRTPREWRAARERALADTPGFTVLARTTGRVDAKMGLKFATLTYRYRSASGKARVVKARWLALDYKGQPAFAEMSAGGRPVDREGLGSVIKTATRGLNMAG